MTTPEKRKAALAGGQAAFLNSSNNYANNTRQNSLKQRGTQLVVAAAVWGLLPVTLAEWIIRRGKTGDAR